MIRGSNSQYDEHRGHLEVAAVALLPARLHGELLADVLPRILPRAVVLERPGPVRHLDELLDDVCDRVLALVPAHTEDVFPRAGCRGWRVVGGGGDHGDDRGHLLPSLHLCLPPAVVGSLPGAADPRLPPDTITRTNTRYWDVSPCINQHRDTGAWTLLWLGACCGLEPAVAWGLL